MHYPVLKETDLAIRWKVSLKTLRGWRQRNVGPRWYKLYERHVRYHVADILEFEANALPQWLAELAAEEKLGRTGKPGKLSELDSSAPNTNFVDAKTIATYAKLPHHLFSDLRERARKGVPHMQVVGVVRFSPLAIWHWELENSVIGVTAAKPVIPKPAKKSMPQTSEPAPRWHEITPLPPTDLKAEAENPLITLHCPTLPSASDDFQHTVQHLITQELQ